VLLVHLVVVLLPLTAAAAAVGSVWPALQRKLTFLIPLGALVCLAAVPVMVRAGKDLAARLGSPPFIENHQEFGEMLLPWTIALAVATTAQWLYLREGRPQWGLRTALAVFVIGSAVGAGVVVFLTGESGARAVWGNA
jgi:hypothetical protein